MAKRYVLCVWFVPYTFVYNSIDNDSFDYLECTRDDWSAVIEANSALRYRTK